jgi:hypothetical protein
MKPTAAQHAIGALKLVSLHLDHPTVIARDVVRAASTEAIERLQAQTPGQVADLGPLYCALLAVTPRGHLPHVTLTLTPATPFGAVITDAHGNVVARQIGKTIDGLAQLIAASFPVGRGEPHNTGGLRDNA